MTSTRPVAAAAEAALRRRCDAVVARWALRDEIVLIGAGAPVSIPGRSDQAYPFRAHSEYFYLTDRDEPGGVLAFDPVDGWTNFVADVTPTDRLWTGAHQADGPTRSRLRGWLEGKRGRTVVCLGEPIDEATGDSQLQTGGRSPAASLASSIARFISRRPWTRRAVWWTSVCCAAIQRDWLIAARAPCSFRTGSGTWSASAFATSEGVYPDVRPARIRRCGFCVLICRCRKVTS